MIGIIIFVIVVIAVIMFFNSYQNKYQSMQGKIFNFLVIGLLAFVLISGLYVYATFGTKISNFESFVSFTKFYFNWVQGVFSNGRNVVGYAVQQDWAVNNTVGK